MVVIARAGRRRRHVVTGAQSTGHFAGRNQSFRSTVGRINMLFRGSIAAMALVAAVSATGVAAQAYDVAPYPDLSGMWRRVPVPGVTGQPGYDQTKIQGRAQEAPLTAEYQAVFEASLKDLAEGGQGNDPTYNCTSPGMPRIMTVYDPMEIVVTPASTHILIEHIHDSRRIYTDGRDWPEFFEPSYRGFSIGKWSDTDGDGRYDLLEVETRGFKGPRSFDATGLPLHFDNETIIKERIYLDKTDPNLLYDEITTIDHALTRPWTVLKKFHRDQPKYPVWGEAICEEGNSHVGIGKEVYYLSADGLLMPAKKGQAPPDLRYFKTPNQNSAKSQ
jgi:hypothetical protein